MFIVEVRNHEIDKLISFLGSNYSGRKKRIWETSTHVYGVFLEDELVIRTMSEQVILILLEHDKERNVCEFEVIPAGGGTGIFRLSWGSHGAAQNTFKEKFEELAKKHGWKWSYTQREIKIKGDKCPHCRAQYIYKDKDLNDDGTVNCQNCGKKFKLVNEQDAM